MQFYLTRQPVSGKESLLPLTHKILGFIPQCDTLEYRLLESPTANIKSLKIKEYGYEIAYSVINYPRMQGSIIKLKKEATCFFNNHVTFGGHLQSQAS